MTTESDELFNNKPLIARLVKQKSHKLSFVAKEGKSSVWKRFVRVLYEQRETDFVKCINCEDIHKSTQFSGTSGLLKHKCQKRVGLSDQLSDNHLNEEMEPFEDMSDEMITADDSNELFAQNNRQFLVESVENGDKSVSFGRLSAKSRLWQRFERILYNNRETNFVKCLKCSYIGNYDQNNYGTGALLKHQCSADSDSVDANQLNYGNDILSTDLSALESDPINDKNYLIELIKANDRRLGFVPEKGNSRAWDRFERIFVDDMQTLYVKCKFCDCIQKHESSSGTSGLIKHRCKRSGADHHSEGSDPKLRLKKDTNSRIIDEKSLIKQLSDENKTLKLIVEKCLKMIDNCLCSKYSSEQKKEINVLINNYNKYVFNGKNCEQFNENNENYVDSGAEKETILGLDYNWDLDSDNNLTDETSVGKIGPNVVNRLELYRNKFANRHRITKSIKNKYKFKKLLCEWPGCGRTFRKGNHLEEHRNSEHLGIKAFMCSWPGCGEQFLKKSQLKAHTIKYHTNDKPFKCDLCHYETTYKALLRRHKRIHSDNKCLSCDWPGCDFRTNYEQGLKAHKLRHSGERPWKCTWPQCTDQFRQSHHLKAHTLKHTGEKPVVCQFLGCDRRFTSRQAMRFHTEKVHSNASDISCVATDGAINT